MDNRRYPKPDVKLSAREILNTMSSHRIDVGRIKFTEADPTRRGGQGAVVVATLTAREGADTENEQKVAVKKLYWDDVSDQDGRFNAFVNELSLMATLSHPNIVILLGFVEDIKVGDAWMITPWEGNGNVREFLQSGEWDIPERVSLIRDTFDGLRYLHSHDPPICHGDLKSLNILVNSEFRAIITDFGSARVKRSITADGSNIKLDYHANTAIESADDASRAPRAVLDASTMELTLSGPKYSLRWAAPEVLSGEEPDLPADIWAAGWICWEIVTGKLPFHEVDQVGHIVAKVTLGKLPNARDDEGLANIVRLCNIMSGCWKSSPNRRPDASSCYIAAIYIPSAVPSGCSSDGRKVRSSRLLLELGRMYEQQSDMKKAEPLYREALETANRTEDLKAQADALKRIARLCKTQYKNSEAEELLIQARGICSSIGDDRGTSSILGDLADVYLEQSKHREAEELYMKADALSSRINYLLGKANARSGLGTLYSRQGKHNRAEECYLSALEIYTLFNMDTAIGQTLSKLADVYVYQQRYNEAEKFVLRARTLSAHVADYQGEAVALQRLGRIYRFQSRNNEAEVVCKEALEIFTRINSDLGVGSALDGLANTYQAQSKLQEAAETYRQAIKVNSGISFDWGHANALVGLGEIAGMQGRTDEAKEFHYQASVLNTRIQNYEGMGSASLGLGLANIDKGEFSQAEGFFNEAQHALKTMGDQVRRAFALLAMAGTLMVQSRDKEAKEVMIESERIVTQLPDNKHRGDLAQKLGDLCGFQKSWKDAERWYTLGKDIYTRIGDEQGQARAFLGLGLIRMMRPKPKLVKAKEACLQAQVILVRIGDDEGQALALQCLIDICVHQGRVQEAAEYCRKAMAVFNRIRPANPLADIVVREFLKRCSISPQP